MASPSPSFWCDACSRLLLMVTPYDSIFTCPYCANITGAEPIVDMLDVGTFVHLTPAWAPMEVALLAAIDAMPIVAVDAAGGTGCAVCMDKLDPGAQALEMPCKHVYHQRCIVPWLVRQSSCRLCRRELPMVEAADTVDGLVACKLPKGRFRVGRRVGGRVLLPRITDKDGKLVDSAGSVFGKVKMGLCCGAAAA